MTSLFDEKVPTRRDHHPQAGRLKELVGMMPRFALPQRSQLLPPPLLITDLVG